MTTIDRPVCAVLLVGFVGLMPATVYLTTWPWPALPLLVVQGLIAAWEGYLLLR